MNAEPHTHKIEIGRRYRSAGGPVEVTYGDTTVTTLRFLQRIFAIFPTNHPSQKRINKVIVKAIKKHDEGSKNAGAEENYLNELQKNSIAEIPANKWASEVIPS